jgi:hypothetical protein
MFIHTARTCAGATSNLRVALNLMGPKLAKGTR